MEFGYEGLGLFYTILEKLAMQEKPIKTDVLKMQLFVGRKLERCWKFLESSGLISSNNGETFNENLLKFSEKYQVKKDKNRERITEWRKNQALADDVTRYNDVTERVRNSPKDNISKVNKSKVNGKSHSAECGPSQEGGFEFLEKAKTEVGNTSLNASLKKASHTRGAPAEIETQDLHYPFDTPNFRNMWRLWNDHRKSIRKPYKSITSEQAALKQLSEFDEAYATGLIERSIAGGYQGLVFDDTKEKYQKQLNAKQNGQSAFQNRPNGTKPSFAGVAAIVDFMSKQDKF